MVDKICDYLTNKIRKQMPEMDDERAEVINYGLHLVVGEVPKTFVFIAIAAILGVIMNAILPDKDYDFSINNSMDANNKEGIDDKESSAA